MRPEPRRRRRTPFRPQFQTTECGVGVLRMMLSHFGRDLSAAEVRRISAVSRDCLNAADLRRAARSLGLECEVRTCEPEVLARLARPLIIHIRFIHFVVLEDLDDRDVTVHCPAQGRLRYSRAHFDEIFTGIALTLRPGPEFQRQPAALRTRRLWWLGQLRGVPPAWTIAAFAGALLQTCAVAICIELAGHGNAVPLLASSLFAAILISFVLPSFLSRQRLVLYREFRRRLIARLAELPAEFYVYRIPARLAETLGSLDGVTGLLTDRLLPAALALLQIVLLLAAGIRLANPAGLAMSVALLAWTAAVAWLTLARRDLEHLAHPTPADYMQRTWNALRRPASERLGSGPEDRRLDALGISAALSELDLHLHDLRYALAAAPFALFAALLGAIRLFGPPDAHNRAALLLLSGAIALAAYPLTRLRGTLSRLRLGAEHIRDILEEPAAEPGSSHEQAIPLSSELRAEDLTFRFNPLKPPVLRGASIRLQAGEHVALTGASGSGKSTLAGLLSGALRPGSGTVTLGGVPLASLPASQRARLIACVDRRPVLFAATLEENITLWAPDIAAGDLLQSIEDAALGEMVRGLPNGLQTMIEAGGANLSGGQQHRVEIARALARNPRILILDDVVDALDAAAEAHILAALRRRGIALLLVGHRATSLAACDRILYFEDGAVTAEPASLDPPPSAAAAALSIFREEVELPATSQPLDDDAALLERCLRRMAHGSTPPPAEVLRALSLREALAAYAKESRLALRRVQLRELTWWNHTARPLLLFRNDGAPALLQPGAFGPRLYDPATNRLTSLRGLDPAAFREHGWTSSPSPPPLARSVRTWLRQMLNACRLSVSVTAIASCFLAIVTTRALVSFALPGPAIRCAVFAAAALSFAAFHSACAARLGVAWREAFEAQWLDLTARFHLALHRSQTAHVLRDRLVRLATVSEASRRLASRGVYATTLALAGVVLLAQAGGARTLFVATAALVPAGLMVLVAASRAARSREARAGASHASTLQGELVLHGALHLRTLDALGRAFARYVDLDDLRLRLERSLVAPPGSMRYPWLLLCPVAVLLVAPPDAQGACVVAATILALAWELSLRTVEPLLAELLNPAPLDELLQQPHTRSLAPVPLPLESLALEAVTLRYATDPGPLFRNLHLHIDAPRLTVITGPSGGGKSTLLRLLLGLMDPLAGSHRVNGILSADLDPASWRAGIAGVFQGDALEFASTIRGILGGFGDRSPDELWAALRMVEMDDEVRAFPMALQTIVTSDAISNGQQQRLLLARALLVRPQLIVMDEATHAIPEPMQARILARIRAAGIGCLVVTHRRSLIEMADIVHVVDHALLFTGDPTAWAASSHGPLPLKESATA